MKEILAHSHYGPGGRKCPCCGPSPSYRTKFDRTAKRRAKAAAKRAMIREINHKDDE